MITQCPADLTRNSYIISSVHCSQIQRKIRSSHTCTCSKSYSHLQPISCLYPFISFRVPFFCVFPSLHFLYYSIFLCTHLLLTCRFVVTYLQPKLIVKCYAYSLMPAGTNRWYTISKKKKRIQEQKEERTPGLRTKKSSNEIALVLMQSTW